jgi:hypothetical protein
MWQLKYSFTILDVGTRCMLSTSRFGRFTPIERAFCTNKIGGWVGRSAGLDIVEYGNSPDPEESRTSVVQTVARRYSDRDM